MSNVAPVAGGLLAGLGLGALFFGGLWLTAGRIGRSANVFGLVLGSFVGRVALAVAGLLLVVRLAGLPGLVAALVGFTVMQVTFLRLSTRRTTPGCHK